MRLRSLFTKVVILVFLCVFACTACKDTAGIGIQRFCQRWGWALES